MVTIVDKLIYVIIDVYDEGNKDVDDGENYKL
jgi:hypothetical protein